MPRPLLEVIAAFRNFEPAGNDWSGLEALLDEMMQAGSTDACLNAVLGLFERFPREDAGEVFWSLARRIEQLPGYERKLIESVRRAPAEFSLKLVNRLLNFGRSEVDGQSLIELLDSVAHDQTLPSATRQTAEVFVSAQDG